MYGKLSTDTECKFHDLLDLRIMFSQTKEKHVYNRLFLCVFSVYNSKSFITGEPSLVIQSTFKEFALSFEAFALHRFQLLQQALYFHLAILRSLYNIKAIKHQKLSAVYIYSYSRFVKLCKIQKIGGKVSLFTARS